MRLSETQRVSFYELVTASLKAADMLTFTCPAETALTPVGSDRTLAQAFCRRAGSNCCHPAGVATVL